MKDNIHIFASNISKVFLTTLRDKQTSLSEFRRTADLLSMLLVPYALNDLPTKKKTIETPLQKVDGDIQHDSVVIVPILRAGLAMLPSALSYVPQAYVGVVGMRRDEQTAIPDMYYKNIPSVNDAHVVVLDPMLATGGSILHVLSAIGKLEFLSLRLVHVICAPEGVDAILQKYPFAQIYTCAVDDGLNEKKFIVPGLGDFGDRYFGTT